MNEIPEHLGSRELQRNKLLTIFYYLVNHKQIDHALRMRPERIKALFDHCASQCINTNAHGLETIAIFKDNLRNYIRGLISII